MTNVLSFEVSGVKGGAVITPRIDGVLLTTLAEQFELSHGMTDPAGGYGGLFYDGGPLDRHFPADTGERVYVLACDCGELGCWPLICMIDAEGSQITWHSFVQPHRPRRDYSSFGPFVFDSKQYEEALRSAQE